MTMIDSNRAAQYITENEGYRRYVYEDTEGIPTIGIGFNLEEGFSEEECQAILRIRMRKAIHELSRKIPAYRDMGSIRKIVMVDLVFNLGLPRLLKFKKMLAAIERKDWEDAADELLDSRYARQVKGRAKRNAYMLRTGEWYR
jgi:lysozyme